MITGTSKNAGFNDGDVFAQLHFDPDFDSAEKQRLMIDVLSSDNNKKYLTSIGEASIASAATRKHDITLHDLQSYLQKVSPNAYRSAVYRDFATYYDNSDDFATRADRISSSNRAQIEAILNLAQEQLISIDENTQVSVFLANKNPLDPSKTNAEILREQVQAYTAKRQYQSPVRYGYVSPGNLTEKKPVDIKKAAKPKKAEVTIAGKKAEKPTFYSSQYKFPAAGGKARLVSLPHVSSLPELRISDKKGTLSEDFSLSMEAILNKSPEYNNLILRSEAIVLGNSYIETIRSIVPAAEAEGLKQAQGAQKSVYNKFFSGQDDDVKLEAASQLYVLNDHINKIQGDSDLDEEDKSAYNATLAFIAKAVVTQKKFLEYEDKDFRDLLAQVRQIPQNQRNAVLNAVAIPLNEELSLTGLTAKVAKKSQSLAVGQAEYFDPAEQDLLDQGSFGTDGRRSSGLRRTATATGLYSSGRGYDGAVEPDLSDPRADVATEEPRSSSRGRTTTATEWGLSGRGYDGADGLRSSRRESISSTDRRPPSTSLQPNGANQVKPPVTRIISNEVYL